MKKIISSIFTAGKVSLLFVTVLHQTQTICVLHPKDNKNRVRCSRGAIAVSVLHDTHNTILTVELKFLYYVKMPLQCSK